MITEATYDEKIQLALESVEEQQAENINQITLSSGVILEFKKVNILRIQAVMDRFEYPEVPMVWDSVKERSYRNPNDPSYQADIQKIDTQRTMAVLDAIAAMGTTPIFVPQGLATIEDDSWVEECKVLKIPVKTDSPLARYMAWIKYVAIVDKDDLIKIGNQFGATLGISEVRVAEQLQSNFPDQ